MRFPLAIRFSRPVGHCVTSIYVDSNAHHNNFIGLRFPNQSIRVNMTSISASTTFFSGKKASGKSPTMSKTVSPATKSPASMSRNSSSSSLYSLGGASSRRMSKRPSSNSLADQARGLAQKLEGLTLKTEAHMASLKLSEPSVVKETFNSLLDTALGVEGFKGSAPRTASDTKSRSVAAADLAGAVKAMGVRSLRKYGVHKAVKDILSQSSPPQNALEGALLIVRALCEIVEAASEPFVVPLIPMMLVHSSHNVGSIRDAAEDSLRSTIQLLNTHAVCIVVPFLFEAFSNTEWRTKATSLAMLMQLAKSSPLEVSVEEFVERGRRRVYNILC